MFHCCRSSLRLMILGVAGAKMVDSKAEPVHRERDLSKQVYVQYTIYNMLYTYYTINTTYSIYIYIICVYIHQRHEKGKERTTSTAAMF